MGKESVCSIRDIVVHRIGQEYDTRPFRGLARVVIVLNIDLSSMIVNTFSDLNVDCSYRTCCVRHPRFE